MIANQSGENDKEAIRFFSNQIMDEMERAGIVTRKESDRLSQDITIHNVQQIMKNMKSKHYDAAKYLVAGYQDAPVYKTVNYNEIEPADDAHAKYRGVLYGTKEDLKYMPSKVRLVEIRQSTPIQIKPTKEHCINCGTELNEKEKSYTEDGKKLHMCFPCMKGNGP